MRESSEYNMVEALKSRRDREKFRGHQAFIITDNDPDLTRVGGIAGHRNTGGKGSLFNEASARRLILSDQTPHRSIVHGIRLFMSLDIR